MLIYLYISCEIKARVTRKWYNGFHIDRPRAGWPWQTTESESTLRLPAQHFSTLNDEKVERWTEGKYTPLFFFLVYLQWFQRNFSNGFVGCMFMLTGIYLPFIYSFISFQYVHVYLQNILIFCILVQHYPFLLLRLLN